MGNQAGYFTQKLKLEYIDGINWQVINPSHRFAFVTARGEVISPNSFVTDFASIPRFFWRILPPTGDGPDAMYGPAAVIHDWLYRHRKIGRTPVSRKRADDIMLECMVSLNVDKWRRNVIWAAVRVFGGIAAWNRHKHAPIP